jgi:uncharacterized membrane protein YoaK (UPF0700 family)
MANAPAKSPEATPPALRPATDPRLVPVHIILGVVTGIVDAVSFLGLGRIFTANMTGNVVLLGFAIADAPGLSIERALAAIFSFVIGSVAGGRFALSMSSEPHRSWAQRAMVTEIVLLIGAAGLALLLSTNPPLAEFGVIVLTGVAMGFRNATARKMGVPDLQTTVLTLTITGLAADSSLAGSDNPRAGRRFASVLAILIGAAAGAVLLRVSMALTLVVAAATVAVAAVYLASPERRA